MLRNVPFAEVVEYDDRSTDEGTFEIVSNLKGSVIGAVQSGLTRKQMRFAFVERHCKSIPTQRLCRIVDVTPRG
jgi:hypothetical protein